MPIFHVQYAPQPGSNPQLTPQAVLVQGGPCVQVTVGLDRNFAAQLTQQGVTLPQPTAGMGLIDTGAFSSCVDDSVAQRMRLPVIDVVTMASASHAATQCNVYPVEFELIGSGLRVGVPRAIGANLQPQGIIALLGRDLLSAGTLFYNGFTGQITFSV